MGFAKFLKKFYGSGEYAGSLMFIIIIVVTSLIQKLTSYLGYKCPCVTPIQVANCTYLGRRTCAHTLNFAYGMSFLLGPVIALYVFGIAANPKMWKSVTGVLNKVHLHRRTGRQVAWTMLGVAGKASISPITWITVAFIDGRYFACAVTTMPYDVGPRSMYRGCDIIAATLNPYPSYEFETNRQFSQIVGWITISGVLLFALTAYTISRCIMPLTYYHALYYEYYRRSEEEEFKDEMEIRAHNEAERNVKVFMKNRRGKEIWDKISTVYSFHRDDKNMALYSNLHEWILEQSAKGNIDLPEIESEDELMHLLTEH